jgi:lipoprotein-releasing system permease protein
MRYILKVAALHLFSSKLLTTFLIGGVGIGVLVYCFMAALINGLNEYQIEQTTGSIAHVILEPSQQQPRVIPTNNTGTIQVATVLSSNFQREQIRFWPEVVATVESHPMVRVVVPVIAGNALIARGQAIAPVSITGIRPEQLSDIADIGSAIIAGDAELNLDGIVIGDRLARLLSVDVGQNLSIRSERNRERSARVRGIYSMGIQSLDEEAVFMNFESAKALLDLEHGISRIDVKLSDLNAAPEVALDFAGSTGLRATSWPEKNELLFRSLEGNSSTGSLIKFFSIVTIVIGVASALLLASMRRRSEIGIMRSMGASKGFITAVFVIQGAMVGLLGAAVGALSGYGFSTLIAELARRADGSPILPIDPSQGAYLTGIILATSASAIAAILPAFRAASIDPLDAISQ